MDYRSLKLVELREIAKERGLKKISSLKKGQLIERLIVSEGQEEIQPKETVVSKTPDNGTVGSSADQMEAKREGQAFKKNVSETEKLEIEKSETEESEIEKSETEKSEIEKSEAEKSEIEKSGTEKSETGEKRQEESSEDNSKREVHRGRRSQGNNRRGRRNNRNDRGNRREDKEHAEANEQSHSEEPAAEVEDPRDENPHAKGEHEAHETEEKPEAEGILEVMQDGYGFIRSDNYMPGANDVYVSPSQIRRFNLKTGDILKGKIRERNERDKFAALLFVESVNGENPYEVSKRKNFEDLTPIFPNEKIQLERPGGEIALRMIDLLSPIGKGQRGMIVSQPKTGKTTLIKQIAKSIAITHPEMKVIILLIDERPEEVTDIREYIEGPNVEVIYSTFDEMPDHHKRVSEMVLDRAKRLVESHKDVIILLDSITRLARAYNLLVPPSGRTLSGGLDPAALYFPKKFFGAARNMREGGSLTILATALVDTGSKMDDVVFEEFKGTGNMELVLDRKLAEKRIFPAINIQKSSTRREDLLLTPEEREVVYALHREMGGGRSEDNVEQVMDFFKKTKTNQELVEVLRRSWLKRQ